MVEGAAWPAPAARARPAADDHLRAGRHRRFDGGVDPGDGRRVDHRADLAGRVGGRARPHAFQPVGQCLGELVSDRPFDQDPAAGHAELAGEDGRGRHRGSDRDVEVRIGKHQVRGLAAKLEADPLEVRRGGLGDEPTGGGAAGEADHRYSRRVHQQACDIGAGFGDDVHHSRRDLGNAGDDLAHQTGGLRRLAGHLHDRGAAGGQGGRQCPDGQVGRRVPRDDQPGHPDRLPDRHRLLPRLGARRAAARIHREAGREAQRAGDEVRLEARLARKLAVLPAQGGDDVAGPGDVGVGKVAQRGRAEHRVEPPRTVPRRRRGAAASMAARPVSASASA